MIDLQWSGVGLAGTDVAYCILASAAPAALFARAADYEALRASIAAGGSDGGAALDCALDDSEEHLIRYYHERLCAALGDTRAPRFDEFMAHYRLAFLDQCRVTLACHWDVPGNAGTGGAGEPPTIVQLLRARQAEGSLLFNACNKSLELACWALRRMRVYLDAL